MARSTAVLYAMPEPPTAAPGEPEHWLGPTELLDLGDEKLRIRARSLTQLCKNDREKALAVYAFVKRIPFARPIKFRLRTPRQVLSAAGGDALDKIGLLVALLRAVDIPARIRYMQLPGAMLRGLISQVSNAARPVVEIHLAGGWVATDTYIFDAAYISAARRRLDEQGWECGFGIHRDGASIWNGCDDAFLVGEAIAGRSLWRGPEGLFDDPAQFARSGLFRSAHPRVASAVRWSVMAPSVGKVIRELREQGAGGAPAGKRRG